MGVANDKMLCAMQGLCGLNPPGDFCAATGLRSVTLREICVGVDEEDSH